MILEKKMTFKNYNYKQRNEIKERYDKFYKEWVHPLLVLPNFFWYMSPIEKNVWDCIRKQWFTMYPQFPVWKYFLDFADPVRKIWIEVDWEEWHLDKEKDIKRQKEIEKDWWEIYRIKWKHSYNTDLSFLLENIDMEEDDIKQNNLQKANTELIEKLNIN